MALLFFRPIDESDSYLSDSKRSGARSMPPRDHVPSGLSVNNAESGCMPAGGRLASCTFRLSQ